MVFESFQDVSRFLLIWFENPSEMGSDYFWDNSRALLVCVKIPSELVPEIRKRFSKTRN